MRRTEQGRLAALEAESAFQNQTLRAIRIIAERAPPEEAQRALRAIHSLAEEALAKTEPEDDDDLVSE
jgi:uncharacterized coiled-coil protein SlyX